MASEVTARQTLTRTWLIEASQAQSIASLADGLGVNHSQLVRYLLRYALSAVESGDLPLETVPCRWTLVEKGPAGGRGGKISGTW